MEKETIIIILVVLASIALVVFLFKRNQKDKKAFIKKLNKDYEKPKEHEYNE